MNFGIRGAKHDWCPETGYCRRCGLPQEWYTTAGLSDGVIVWCISQSNKIRSLFWYRRLVAHRALGNQLVASVAAQMDGAIKPKGD